MPWIEKRVEMLREEFIARSMEKDRNMTALCEEYRISRKTGYKWIKRFSESGQVKDQSRKPHHSRVQTDAEMEQRIVDVRRKYPGWGARKITDYLQHKGCELPCEKTIQNILKRHGLISAEATQAHKPWKRFERAKSNELWQADFKGDFLLGDGQRCYPLTILDDHSRFALRIEPRPHQRGVQDSFWRTFQEYGLPQTLLTDNGPYFAGYKKGYNQFERALMDQDVLPIHGRFGHPQTQGKIERFHRSLQEEVLKYQTLRDLEDAAQVLEQWRTLYNHERPHAALAGRCPAQLYTPSQRAYREKVPPFEYNPQFHLYKINNWGFLRFSSCRVYISETFADTWVQLVPREQEDRVQVCYRNFVIACVDLSTGELASRRAYRLQETL